eukprot:SAG25_NODE_87_length_16363_cov_40.489179_2_plen_134_part_00
MMQDSLGWIFFRAAHCAIIFLSVLPTGSACTPCHFSIVTCMDQKREGERERNMQRDDGDQQAVHHWKVFSYVFHRCIVHQATKIRRMEEWLQSIPRPYWPDSRHGTRQQQQQQPPPPPQQPLLQQRLCCCRHR